MFESLDILRMAQAYATHAATRQQAISQNVANADTPGYRSRDAIAFGDYWQSMQNGSLRPEAMLQVETQPATMSPDGNTVSLEFEMMRGVEARQQHELALGIYSMTRDLMRASLGK